MPGPPLPVAAGRSRSSLPQGRLPLPSDGPLHSQAHHQLGLPRLWSGRHPRDMHLRRLPLESAGLQSRSESLVLNHLPFFFSSYFPGGVARKRKAREINSAHSLCSPTGLGRTPERVGFPHLLISAPGLPTCSSVSCDVVATTMYISLLT